MPSDSEKEQREEDGRWSMADGQWPMANGQWLMANGQWPIANGRWTRDDDDDDDDDQNGLNIEIWVHIHVLIKRVKIFGQFGLTIFSDSGNRERIRLIKAMEQMQQKENKGVRGRTRLVN